jgi:outer membrane receptor protein involved in Fe transport
VQHPRSTCRKVVLRTTEGVTLRTALYQAYRTPTLNELHRGFRVGDTITDGNPLLDPEQLIGAEADRRGFLP